MKNLLVRVAAAHAEREAKFSGSLYVLALLNYVPRISLANMTVNIIQAAQNNGVIKSQDEHRLLQEIGLWVHVAIVVAPNSFLSFSESVSGVNTP